VIMKLDATVKRETIYIALWTAILSVIMQIVFIACGRWDYTVLLGNVFSAFVAVGNFFLLGITVQKAVAKEDEKEARNIIKTSHSLRTLMLFVCAALGALLPCFNIWTSLVPLLFPRVAILFRGFQTNK